MDDVVDNLVREHLWLARLVAQKLAVRLPDYVEVEDLEQWGFFGLLDAARRFDTGRGIRFTTYAGPRIRGAILDGIRSFDWVPRLTRSRSRKIGEAVDALTAATGRIPADGELARYLKLDAERFALIAKDRVAAGVASLSRKGFESDSGRDVETVDLRADPHAPRRWAGWSSTTSSRRSWRSCRARSCGGSCARITWTNSP